MLCFVIAEILNLIVKFWSFKVKVKKQSFTLYSIYSAEQQVSQQKSDYFWTQ